jgi:hypothetical protein
MVGGESEILKWAVKELAPQLRFGRPLAHQLFLFVTVDKPGSLQLHTNIKMGGEGVEPSAY